MRRQRGYILLWLNYGKAEGGYAPLLLDYRKAGDYAPLRLNLGKVRCASVADLGEGGACICG